MKQHDRFESLAGAIALGEASLEEREAFAAHAAACALCRQDLEEGDGSLLASVGAARDDETWRPSIDRVVLARIRERSAKRWKLTVGALGWGAALSIAVNVAFVTGIASQVSNVLHPAATVDVPQTASFVRLPARTFARVASVSHPKGLPAPVALRAPHRVHPVAPAFAAAIAKAPVRVPALGASDAGDISDLLDTNSSAIGHSVAIEISLPCTERRTTECTSTTKVARRNRFAFERFCGMLPSQGRKRTSRWCRWTSV